GVAAGCGAGGAAAGVDGGADPFPTERALTSRVAEDVLWRRSKLGLRLDAAQAARLQAWMGGRIPFPRNGL
ncbi:hypothetical protein C7E25_12490, partial [Stenotrophomonas maltophilia]